VHLHFESGSLAGKVVELPLGLTVIGRADDCDLQLPDAGVSAHHVELHVEPGLVTVRDLGSRNGTFVDGERLSGSRAVRDGAKLGMGPVVAAFGPITNEVPAVRGHGRGNRLPIALSSAALLVSVVALAVAFTRAGDDAGGGRQLAATPTPTATPTPFTKNDAYERGQRSAVLINVDDTRFGSGWVIESNAGEAFVITNEHVVGGGRHITVDLDGEAHQPLRAELVSADGCDDLALLRVANAEGFKALSLGDEPHVGDDMFVVGFPEASTDGVSLSVKGAGASRVGVTLTGPDRPADAVYRDLIEIDGSVIPGNSGGPLLAQADGSVAGVISLSEDFIGRESVGYAITAARVAQVLPYLRDGKSVPGMSLEYFEDGAAPRIRGVTSPTLIRGGVVPNAGQRVVSVDGKAFGGELEASLHGLCGELPQLGDGQGTTVTYKIRKPDGNSFRVRVEY
jgi:S1-C subfamily serine protease